MPADPIFATVIIFATEPDFDKTIMLDCQIDLCNKRKSHLEFIALNEKMLLLTKDISLRLELAIKYSDQKEYNAALLHYKICKDIESTHTFTNNLCVVYSELDMPSKAIDMFQLSFTQDGDVAIGNLANIFYESNFLANAYELCLTGIKEKKDIARLSEYLAKINKQIGSENVKERSCIASAERLQKYNLEYADAYIDKLNYDINGTWSGDGFEINIIIKDNQMTADGIFDSSKINNGIGLLSGYLIATQTKKSKISYNGLLNGRGIAFYMSTSSLDKGSDLAADYQFTPGLMIIKDTNTICVYEMEPTCKQQFYTLNRE